jgi:hypothetical protein
MNENSVSTLRLKGLWVIGVVLVILAACSAPPVLAPAVETANTPVPEPTGKIVATALLTIQTQPAGAQVLVDGQAVGTSPITLTLAPGDHRIAVSADGFLPLTETITLAAGQQGIYSPALADVTPPVVMLAAEPREVPWLGRSQVAATATDNAGVSELQVVLDGHLLGSVGGGELALELAPAAVPGLTPGGVYTLTARAADAAGNAGQVSLPLIVGPLPRPTISPVAATASPAISPTLPRPTITPLPPTAPPAASPAPTVVAAPAVSYRVTEVIIPTYPYMPFLRPAIDPATGEFPLTVLDRAAYEASNPRPVPVTYRLIVLENRYLRLSLLPDLGGRVYECIFKPTGNNEFYRNPVVKPTNWGPPSPPYPTGANWWLAVGGLEFGFPVEEHGCLWGARWGYDIVTNHDGSVTVTLLAGDFTRPYVSVAIVLPPDAGFFTVSPTIVNPTAGPFRFKWWANAMLAPGPANAVGPDLRFIFPTTAMTVHSAGDPTLPGPGQLLPWPTFNGRDLSRLGTWTGWLGFFQRPAAAGGYMGVYDASADEGMVRVYPPEVARGAKGFGMGWQNPIDPRNWTDDGSTYVELHGGLAPTFDDWVTLPAGGRMNWTERWYPVAAIGGVSYAAAAGAMNLAPAGNALRVGIFPIAAVRGQLKLAVPGLVPINRPVEISPGRPFNEQVALTDTVPAQGELSLSLTDERGEVVLAWRGEVRLR